MKRLPEHIERAVKRTKVEVLSAKRTGGDHIKLVVDGGVVFASLTPSDWRGSLNLASQIRRVNGGAR
jgi:hypothetical protein